MTSTCKSVCVALLFCGAAALMGDGVCWPTNSHSCKHADALTGGASLVQSAHHLQKSSQNSSATSEISQLTPANHQSRASKNAVTKGPDDEKKGIDSPEDDEKDNTPKAHVVIIKNNETDSAEDDENGHSPKTHVVIHEEGDGRGNAPKTALVESMLFQQKHPLDSQRFFPAYGLTLFAEFVHDGHCGGKAVWEGTHANQEGVMDCANKCILQGCGYLAHNKADKNCACYSKSGGCPDDNLHGSYNAYKIWTDWT